MRNCSFPHLWVEEFMTSVTGPFFFFITRPNKHAAVGQEELLRAGPEGDS